MKLMEIFYSFKDRNLFSHLSVIFQKSRWLKGQLVLLLNESFSAKLCGVMVTYSRDSGLTYTKEEAV